LPASSTIGYGSEGFRKLSDIPKEELTIEKGYYCPVCRAKLRELEAMYRAQNAATS